MPLLQISPLFEVLILAVVQGIAEFLPISSSGHLVAIESILGRHSDRAELGIVLHFGTLLAILVFYWPRIVEMLTRDRKVLLALFVGTIPAASLGIWLKTNHEWLLKSPLLAGFMLVVTAYMLMLLPKTSANPEGEAVTGDASGDYRDLSYRAWILIGLAQAFALLPGISRSGSTIVMGNLCGLKRQDATTFSFLLAIPAIGGASLLEAKSIWEHGAQTPVWHLALGTGVAFLVGLISLRWLVALVDQGRLHWFAYWLIPAGFAIIVWRLIEISNGSTIY